MERVNRQHVCGVFLSVFRMKLVREVGNSVPFSLFRKPNDQRWAKRSGCVCCISWANQVEERYHLPESKVWEDWEDCSSRRTHQSLDRCFHSHKHQLNWKSLLSSHWDWIETIRRKDAVSTTSCPLCLQPSGCNESATADLLRFQSLDHSLRNKPNWIVCTWEQSLQRSGPWLHQQEAVSKEKEAKIWEPRIRNNWVGEREREAKGQEDVKRIKFIGNAVNEREMQLLTVQHVSLSLIWLERSKRTKGREEKSCLTLR